MKKRKWPAKKLPDSNLLSGKNQGTTKNVLHTLSHRNLARMVTDIFRVLGASTKIIDKWDEMAYLRDVTIAAKDQEVEESRKLLKETKQRQTQLGKRFHDYFVVLHFTVASPFVLKLVSKGLVYSQNQVKTFFMISGLSSRIAQQYRFFPLVTYYGTFLNDSSNEIAEFFQMIQTIKNLNA